MRTSRTSFPWLPVALLAGLTLAGGTLTAREEPRRAAPSAQGPGEDESSASQALDVLQKRCGTCHGPTGFAKTYMLLDRAALVANGKVIPGRPENSLLYRRVTGDLEPLMPEGGPRLPDGEIAKIKRWIDDGAPPWNAPSTPRRRIISNDEVVAAIEQDLMSFEEEGSRRYQRYFVLTNLSNAQDPKLAMFRVALFKLLNSLSWENAILRPAVIDKEETIFRVDLRDFDWNDATWRTILAGYPYGVRLPTAGYTHIQRMTASNVPFIRADWFLVAASLPPLYHDILELPATERELESCGPGVKRCLHIDAARNLRDAAGIRVARAGFTESGVSNNNRIVERHRSSFGAYWKSYDFPDNVGAHNIFQRPMDFERAGGEIIFNLPNGLQAYLLVDQKGNRIDQAPTNIVFNKSSGRPEIRNGQSCMACHVNGMRPLTDDVRATLAALGPDLRRDASALYVDGEFMKALLLEDQKRFENAVRQTGARPGEEPLVEVSQRYQTSLNAATAAAELGLTEAELLQRLAASPQLQQLGMATLASGGAIKRDTWESEFGRIAEILGLGSYERPARVYGERFFAGGAAAPAIAVTTISAAPNVRRLNLPPIAFVRVEPGTFQMGCSADDTQCDTDEKAAHPVRISRRFEIGTHEVTQEQWQAVMGNNPSFFKRDNNPVENVSWNDVREFLNRLNAQNDGFRYRLPTEAEWEYVARAGAAAPAAQSPEETAWFLDNSGKQSQPVGSRKPNSLGLYDMQGNVAEWVQDGYTSFYAPALAVDPTGPAANSSTARVIRGGSWNDVAKDIRVSRRDALNPTRRLNFLGFRLVREATR